MKVNEETADIPVKILVIADTHVKSIAELPATVSEKLNEADMIIHLGDFGDVELCHELRETGRFKAVYGNHDNKSVRKLLPEKDIIEVNGKKLALYHGRGCYPIFGMSSHLASHFKGTKVDAILFGHTHVAANEMVDGTLFFNPGTTAHKFPTLKPSYGILTIDGSIHAEIHYLDDSPEKVSFKTLLGYATRHFIYILPPRPMEVIRNTVTSFAVLGNIYILANFLTH